MSGSAAAGVLVLLVAFGLFVSDYYHADTEAIAAFGVSEGIFEGGQEDRTLVYAPAESEIRLIFYLGGIPTHPFDASLFRPGDSVCTLRDAF